MAEAEAGSKSQARKEAESGRASEAEEKQAEAGSPKQGSRPAFKEKRYKKGAFFFGLYCTNMQKPAFRFCTFLQKGLYTCSKEQAKQKAAFLQGGKRKKAAFFQKYFSYKYP